MSRQEKISVISGSVIVLVGVLVLVFTVYAISGPEAWASGSPW